MYIEATCSCNIVCLKFYILQSSYLELAYKKYFCHLFNIFHSVDTILFDSFNYLISNLSIVNLVRCNNNQ